MQLRQNDPNVLTKQDLHEVWSFFNCTEIKKCLNNSGEISFPDYITTIAIISSLRQEILTSTDKFLIKGNTYYTEWILNHIS